jgi:hypothetical protein
MSGADIRPCANSKRCLLSLIRLASRPLWIYVPCAKDCGTTFSRETTYVILNAVSPNTSVSDEVARTVTDEFNLPVSDIRLGSRVAYSRCMITGQTAAEFEPQGKAAREVAKLYKGQP